MSVAPYSVEAFNQVSDYHDVRHFGDKDKKLPAMAPVINKFGNLYIEHKKHKHAALSLSHRHFHLRCDEKKLARCVGNKRIEIAATSEKEIQELLSANEGSRILPYHFLPMKNNGGKATLIPLEYVFLTKRDESKIKAMEEDIQAICDERFVDAFLALADDNKVDGVYGISLQNKDTLHVDLSKESTLEGSGDGPRTLVVNVVDKNETVGNSDVTTVAWYFHEDKETGTVVPYSACSSLRHGDPDSESGPQCSHCGLHCSGGWHRKEQLPIEHGPQCYPHCYHCGRHCSGSWH